MDKFRFLVGLYMIAIAISLYLMAGNLDTIKKNTKPAEPVITTVTTTTTVPYSGIKCMVNGYEVKTDLANAKAAGCK